MAKKSSGQEIQEKLDPQKAAEVLAKERQERARKCAEEFRVLKDELEQKHKCVISPVVIVRSGSVIADWEVTPIG